MEFDPRSFALSLKQKLSSGMPHEENYKKKHKDRIGTMRDLALDRNAVIPLLNKGYYFEIGNQLAEKQTPQYHILEDSEVIRLKGKGTKTSKGSQALVKNVEDRDYGKWTISKIKNTEKGQNVSVFQEYRKNVRGSRSRVNSARKTIIVNGQKTIINPTSNYYYNKHYHYIENILKIGVPQLANEFGLKVKRTKTDFTEEIKQALANK